MAKHFESGPNKVPPRVLAPEEILDLAIRYGDSKFLDCMYEEMRQRNVRFPSIESPVPIGEQMEQSRLRWQAQAKLNEPALSYLPYRVLTKKVVGKVLTIEEIPGADEARVSQIDTGEPESRQIMWAGRLVLTVGQCVVVALPGAKYRKANGEEGKLRKRHWNFTDPQTGKRVRVDSYGMICSPYEAGMNPEDSIFHTVQTLPPNLEPGTEIVTSPLPANGGRLRGYVMGRSAERSPYAPRAATPEIHSHMGLFREYNELGGPK